MITRRVLVTTTEDQKGVMRRYYGRYDAVKLAANNEKIVESKFKNYKCKEEDFIKIAKEI